MVDKTKAVNLQKQLSDFEVIVLEEDGFYKVIVGIHLTRQDAIEFRQKHSILKNGFVRLVQGAVI